MKITLGISLKMYFGYQQTMHWCQQIACLLQDETRAASDLQLTLFTLPSAPVIHDAIHCFTGTSMAVGAQNIAPAPSGAWTGETSAAMLKEMGCRYVEIGHAERRQHFHEDEDMLRCKIRLALLHGLIPVVCIGENQRVSPQQALQIACEQASSLLFTLDRQTRSGLIFAWEPWWAIGASSPASDDYVCEVCSGLRRYLYEHYLPQPDPAEPYSPQPHRVIYGGSAGPGMLSRLYPYVDGLFLGRFAHNPQAVGGIIDEAIRLLRNQQKMSQRENEI